MGVPPMESWVSITPEVVTREGTPMSTALVLSVGMSFTGLGKGPFYLLGICDDDGGYAVRFTAVDIKRHLDTRWEPELLAKTYFGGYPLFGPSFGYGSLVVPEPITDLQVTYDEKAMWRP